MFKVGDAVRVKAGSPVWKCGFELTARYPLKSWFGGLQKISASPANSDPTQVCIGATKVDPIYLEPWNDAEEWNGTAWVKKSNVGKMFRVTKNPGYSKVNDGDVFECARDRGYGCIWDTRGLSFWIGSQCEEVAKESEKAKPAIVVMRGRSYIRQCESTNEAFKVADKWAADTPGTEYVVYQEKGSRVVEKKKKSKAELLHEEIQEDINNSRSYESVSRKTSATLTPCHSHYDADGHLLVKYKVT